MGGNMLLWYNKDVYLTNPLWFIPSTIDTNREKLRSRISSRDISFAYDKFKESFNSTKYQLSDAVFAKDFDAHVDGVFTFIRLLRNSIVHPAAIPNITSALVYSNLQQFSYYIETVFKLIEHYQSNKTKV